MSDKRISAQLEQLDEEKISRIQDKNEYLRLRFLNPRLRMVGRDLDALKLQVEEKKLRKQQELEDSLLYDRHLQQMEISLRKADLEHRATNKKNQNDLANHWKEQIAMRDRLKKDLREQDLKDGEVKENPGLSGAQLFDGEDPAYEKRKMMQAMQLQRWTKEQLALRDRKKQEEKEQEMLHADHVRNFVDFADRAFQEQELARKKAREEIRDYNLKLAEDKRNAKIMERQNAIADERRELETDGGIIDPEKGVDRRRHDNPFRYCPDRFKGMSRDELLKFREAQKLQIQERLDREQLRRQDEIDWAKQQERVLQVASEVAYEQQKMKHDSNREYLAFQRKQFEDKNKYNEQRRKLDNAWGYEDSFFERFGKSHR